MSVVAQENGIDKEVFKRREDRVGEDIGKRGSGRGKSASEGRRGLEVYESGPLYGVSYYGIRFATYFI